MTTTPVWPGTLKLSWKWTSETNMSAHIVLLWQISFSILLFAFRVTASVLKRQIPCSEDTPFLSLRVCPPWRLIRHVLCHKQFILLSSFLKRTLFIWSPDISGGSLSCRMQWYSSCLRTKTEEVHRNWLRPLLPCLWFLPFVWPCPITRCVILGYEIAPLNNLWMSNS